MVKRTLCSMAIVATLAALVALPAAAQNKPSPVPALSWEIVSRPSPGQLAFPVPKGKPLGAPSYCNPCLFYGGDFDSSNPDANGFFNGDTSLVPDTATYTPFMVPAGQVWTVSGLFTNDLTNFSALAPKEAIWSISSGLSAGNGGTVLASGTSPASFTLTGRSGFGYTEWTTLVNIPHVTLHQGVYWLSVEPVCTIGSACEDGISYNSSSIEQLNTYGPNEPQHLSFFNSSYFGYTYANICVLSDVGCNGLSSGVLGTSSGN